MEIYLESSPDSTRNLPIFLSFIEIICQINNFEEKIKLMEIYLESSPDSTRNLPIFLSFIEIICQINNFEEKKEGNKLKIISLIENKLDSYSGCTNGFINSLLGLLNKKDISNQTNSKIFKEFIKAHFIEWFINYLKLFKPVFTLKTNADEIIKFIKEKQNLKNIFETFGYQYDHSVILNIYSGFYHGCLPILLLCEEYDLNEEQFKSFMTEHFPDFYNDLIIPGLIIMGH